MNKSLDIAMRNFNSDPNPTSARILISIMQRLNIKLPNLTDEIKVFCEYNSKKIIAYLQSMDYGDPSIVVCELFRDSRDGAVLRTRP